MHRKMEAKNPPAFCIRQTDDILNRVKASVILSDIFPDYISGLYLRTIFPDRIPEGEYSEGLYQRADGCCIHMSGAVRVCKRNRLFTAQMIAQISSALVIDGIYCNQHHVRSPFPEFYPKFHYRKHYNTDYTACLLYYKDKMDFFYGG